MLIREFQSPNMIGELVAISEFLINRSEDTDAKKTISTSAFINLARQQGMSLTVDQLKELIQKPPLSNLIADVQGDSTNGTVVFKGEDVGPTADTMTVDQARQTVDSMAKRAIDIK